MDILFGQFDEYFQAFVILMIIDYLSGIISAIYKKEVNSSVGYKGILKKVGILLCISLARQIDILGIYDSKVIVRSVVLMFFTVNEIFSILENLGHIGIPIPTIFLSILEKVKSSENKSNTPKYEENIKKNKEVKEKTLQKVFTKWYHYDNV